MTVDSRGFGVVQLYTSERAGVSKAMHPPLPTVHHTTPLLFMVRAARPFLLSSPSCGRHRVRIETASPPTRRRVRGGQVKWPFLATKLSAAGFTSLLLTAS